MRIIGLLVALLCVGAPSRAAQRDRSVVVDGVSYTLLGNNSLTCKGADKKSLVDVEIKPSVKIGNLEYIVTEIATDGFKDCKNMITLTVPNTVKKIGKRAFWNCRALESAVLPDEAAAVVNEGNYGFGNKGVFAGCESLSKVRGTEIMYPRYVIYDAFFNCDEVPFYHTILELGSAVMEQTKLVTTFTALFREKVNGPVERWQMRKPYETVAQWESRVNDESRRKMIEESVAGARRSYIDQFAPARLRGTLRQYDAANGIYPVDMGQFGVVYVAVPPDEAEMFARRWSSVEVAPKYGILDDRLGVVDCEFAVDGKRYKSVTSFDEDDFGELIASITSLSSVKEYENMANAGEKPARPALKFDLDKVDIDIPVSSTVNDRTFAVIIGNENYTRVSPVEYAGNDARIFAKYCERALGIPESNIRAYYDISFGDMLSAMDDLKNIAEAHDGNINVVFYYAGHGIPDVSSRESYLLPIDASGYQTEGCFPLRRLYDELGALNALSVTAFIDACFSGSVRGDGMLASMRGVSFKPRKLALSGNMCVLSAASADQAALPYPEKNHGMFTYYLLSKLHESGGDVTVGELADYVVGEVSRQSVVYCRKMQKPSVSWSFDLGERWRELKLR